MRVKVMASVLALVMAAGASAQEVKPYVARPVEPVGGGAPVAPVKPAESRPIERHEATEVTPYVAKTLDGSMPTGAGGQPAPVPGGITPGAGPMPQNPRTGAGGPGPAVPGGPVNPGSPKHNVRAAVEPACAGTQIQGNTAINAAGTNLNTLAMGAGNAADTRIGAINCAQIQGNTTINASGTNVNTAAVGAGNSAKGSIGAIGR